VKRQSGFCSPPKEGLLKDKIHSSFRWHSSFSGRDWHTHWPVTSTRTKFILLI